MGLQMSKRTDLSPPLSSLRLGYALVNSTYAQARFVEETVRKTQGNGRMAGESMSHFATKCRGL